MTQILKISSFRDITAFVLSSMPTIPSVDIQIKYVRNADEAHNDLKNGDMDIVCMSYDDTLSIYHEENFKNIIAIAPIHGGMLSLCGNTASSDLKIAIDTDSGYARLLRKHLKNTASHIEWVYAGATNLRAEKLLNNDFDATLLNPPFCYHPQINIVDHLTGSELAYQGMVINTQQSFYQNNQALLDQFLASYYQTIDNILDNPQQIIEDLQNFYHISAEQAQKTFSRLLAKDGLSRSSQFNQNALKNTEALFSNDANIPIGDNHAWVKHI